MSTDEIHDGIARLGRLLQPRGPVIALPAGFCLGGRAAAERAASRTNIEAHELRPMTGIASRIDGRRAESTRGIDVFPRPGASPDEVGSVRVPRTRFTVVARS